MAPFWSPFWCKIAPFPVFFSTPRRDRHLKRFSLENVLVLERRGPRKSWFYCSKTNIFNKFVFSLPSAFGDRFSMIFDHFYLPKTTPKQEKNDARNPIVFGLDFSRFLHHFGTILAPFWLHFAALFEPKLPFFSPRGSAGPRGTTFLGFWSIFGRFVVDLGSILPPFLDEISGDFRPLH